MGVIDSPFNPEHLKILPDVGRAINKFHDLGYLVIVVSNQPGLAKGKIKPENFKKISVKMKKELKKDKAWIDGEYYCFHHPDGILKEYTQICNCRKPKPGMILQAAKEYDIRLNDSWMIGDSLTDIQAGQKAGCNTILIGRMKCDLCKLMQEKNVKPDIIVPNLFKASLIIEKS